MFIITGWLAAIYCILSALAFIGSNKQSPAARVIGTLLSLAVATWIIKALSILS
jgi:hypothetical protein